MKSFEAPVTIKSTSLHPEKEFLVAVAKIANFCFSQHWGLNSGPSP
jgi:hypothetical protein